jgi:S-adenosylmethionine-diacylglycerol 3-amino-3-carboxypropyl transferase
MNSEFYNVALNRLRYSLVWEDSRTLYEALAIEPNDEVLVITSAGCNVFNALLANPSSVTAIDLNPVQNRLLLLKCQLIRNHEPRLLRALMGFDGPGSVGAAWQEVASALPPEMRLYWAPFFATHPGGILTAGKLEEYILGFLPTLDPTTQQKLRHLLEFETVAAQQDFFAAELDRTPFQQQFISYFDEANLSKGRDPALFKYALESGGEAFYARLKTTVSTKLVRDNFFFRFFFFGPVGLPEALLPPAYQARNHERLRELLPKLKVLTGEATSYLNSPAGRTISKASLSNIFEYTSPEEFLKVMAGLFGPADRPLRLVYWNLLQNQGGEHEDRLPISAASGWLSREDACFYFRNVRVLDSRLAAIAAQASHLLLS